MVKFTFFILLLTLNIFTTEAWSALSLTLDLNLVCEEGIGNIENPKNLISISGNFNTEHVGVVQDSDKQKIKVTIFTDKEIIVLNSRDFNLDYNFEDENGNIYFSLEIKYQDKIYNMITTPGGAILLSIKSPGMFWGSNYKNGSCY